MNGRQSLSDLLRHNHLFPGNEGAVRAMLEVPGIDLKAKDGNGRSIVEVAREVGNHQLEKLLSEKCSNT